MKKREEVSHNQEPSQEWTVYDPAKQASQKLCLCDYLRDLPECGEEKEEEGSAPEEKE